MRPRRSRSRTTTRSTWRSSRPRRFRRPGTWARSPSTTTASSGSAETRSTILPPTNAHLGVLAKATAQMQECVGVPPVLAELGAQGGFVFLLAMPEEIMERFGIPNDSFVQCRETDCHVLSPVADAVHRA